MNIIPELSQKIRYELDRMADVFAAFAKAYPSFNQTQLLDEWRETEYSRLDANGQIYLDYTGIGALLIRKTIFQKLKRPWFAGGTVNFASVQGNGHYLAPNEAAYEDGTVNYLNIPAVKTGLKHLEKVGIDTIGERVHCLTGWLLENLLSLQHGNGKPMVRIYGPTDTEMRGGTVTLNFYGPDERLLDYRRIEELANEKGISLRTGCFCNPGAGEIAEGLTTEDMMAGLNNGPDLSLPHFLQVIQQFLVIIDSGCYLYPPQPQKWL